LGLLVAPFPGLQQLALFSSIGLIAAYASVVCWYPVLAVKPGQERPLPQLNRILRATGCAIPRLAATGSVFVDWTDRSLRQCGVLVPRFSGKTRPRAPSSP
ncbi:hypothetical protein AB4559_23560, partial [Vibrio sp. 10N.222.51.C8]|uniref:hypothetical protein n=1 Tax=Vibrio sp. 10N.222.51.C8 TaxID=3229624 RepID=UPI00354F58CC